jgi:hypothetical protein
MNQEQKQKLGNAIFNIVSKASLVVPFFFDGNNPITLRPFADANAAKELTLALVKVVEELKDSDLTLALVKATEDLNAPETQRPAVENTEAVAEQVSTEEKPAEQV